MYRGYRGFGGVGGDGGYGGHIIVKGNEQMWTLLHLKYQTHIFAEHGGSGSGNHRHGKDGESQIIEVPLGTIAKESSTGKILQKMIFLIVWFYLYCFYHLFFHFRINFNLFII